MSDHTPGPWVGFPHGDSFTIRAKIDGQSVDIAYVASMGRSAKEFENARLIAAAPELAEALMAFRPMMADGCDCIYSTDDENSKRCPCKMMHAALAKAGL